MGPYLERCKNYHHPEQGTISTVSHPKLKTLIPHIFDSLAYEAYGHKWQVSCYLSVDTFQMEHMETAHVTRTTPHPPLPYHPFPSLTVTHPDPWINLHLYIWLHHITGALTVVTVFVCFDNELNIVRYYAARYKLAGVRFLIMAIVNRSPSQRRVKSWVCICTNTTKIYIFTVCVHLYE